MKRRSRLTSVICLLLILCMLFTSCKIEEPDLDDDDPTVQAPDNNKPSDGCTHANTALRNVKAATCQETGWSGDYVCTACTAIVTPGSETPKLDHTYDGGRVTKEPTCIEQGTTTFTCSGCGTTKIETIATVAHSDAYHDVLDGTHLHTCTSCPLNEKEQHTPAGAGNTVAASCTEDGYTEYTCSACSGVYKVYSATDKAKGHSFSSWDVTSVATCKAKGEKTQTCLNGCGHENTVVLPMSNNHRMAFDRYTISPSCNSDGEACYKCRDCGMESYKQIPATGVHNYQTVGATGDGWVVKVCTGCGSETSSFDASTVTKAELNTSDINKDTSLEMNMESSAILFPQEVVSQITSGSDVSISADVLDDAKKNEAISNIADTEQREILENAPIYDFTVTIDDQVFSDNFSSPVAITVPYVNDGGESEAIVIYYLSESGNIEEITDVSYNEETGMLTFFVSHFSYYAVAYRETQDMRCRRGVHEFVSTGETVTASCYSFGYTVYQCTNCYDTTLDDITARLDHNYGEIIDAEPTCERGDYVKRICQNPGCGDVLEITYVGATGHVMDAPATCTTSCSCTVCGKVLSRPLGHKWTEWETVVEPGATTNGISRRYCTVCGKVDETTLASSGTVEALEYETYTELINVVLEQILGFTGGEITYTIVESGRYETTFNATIQKTQKGYRMIVEGIDTRYNSYPDVVDNVSTIEFYYDNGVFVAFDPSGDAYASDLDELVPYSVEVFKQVLTDVHSQLDPIAGEGFDVARETLDEYLELLGDDIDAALAAAGSDYTAEQLKSVIDAAETVYAYISLKLGLATDAEIKEGVILPTREDFYTVLSAFMSVSEKDGITTYSLSATPILEEINIIVDYLEEHEEDTLSEFIYAVIGNKAKELDPTLTDFNAIIDMLNEEFPGTLTLSDAVDKLVLLDEESDAFSLASLYEVANLILGAYTGNSEMDIEAEITANGSLTLDRFIAMVMGENPDESAGITDALFDYIKRSASEITLGEVEVGYRYPLSDFINELKFVLDNSEITGYFAFSVDEDGRLVGIELDHDFFANLSGDPSSPMSNVESLKVSLKHNASTTVTVPEQISPLLVDIETYYDNDGNLIITGLKDGIDYSFGIQGYGAIDFDEVLELDSALTAELGYNVYVLKSDYWYENQSVGSYYYYNGNYYSTSSYLYSSCYIVDKELTLNAIVSNPDLIKNYSYYYGSKNMGSLIGSFGEIEVVETPLGIVYTVGDETRVSANYGRRYSEYGYNYEYYVYDYVVLDELLENVTVSSVETANSDMLVNVNHSEYYKLLEITLSFGNGGSYTVYGYECGGEYGLVATGSLDYFYSVSYYDFTTPVELPECDSVSISSGTHNVYTKVNGELTRVSVKSVYLYNKVPSYYLEIADGVYTSLNEYQTLTNFDENAETLALPDGNTLYLIGWDHDNSYAYEFGYDVTYGYVKSPSGRYHRTIAVVDEGAVVEVLYYNASEDFSINFDRVYDVEDYMTQTADGSYVIEKAFIDRLKSLCKDDEDMFFFTVEGSGSYNGVDVEFMYTAGGYVLLPELGLDDIIGGTAGENLFYELFDKNGGESDTPSGPSGGYSVVLNGDGSVTLAFAGKIYDLMYDFNNAIPADSILVYDKEMSEGTGLNIYSYSTQETATYWTDYYVYSNGKYYSFNEYSVYNLDLTASLKDVLDIWYVSNAYYRFDTVGSGDLPANVPVYGVTLRFDYSNLGHHDNNYITIYAFVIDGQIYAATGARVTGESLLTFDGYMPLGEYVSSLVVETNSNYGYSAGIWNNNGTNVEAYYAGVYVYEGDGSGNKKSDTPIGEIMVPYVVDGGVKKYVKAHTSVGNTYSIGEEVTVSSEALNGERHEYVRTYLNGTVTLVDFSYERIITEKYYFIKLADKYYEYEYRYWGDMSYMGQRLDEYEFSYQALDKKWCYAVIDEETGEYTYYTEFIPSDYGFAPSGSLIDPATLEGAYDWTETLLGYTADGDTLVELSYYVTEDNGDEFSYTVEEQSDGTVFYHVNGKGYLKDQAGFYVPARKVTYEDGRTEIVCLLRGAYVYDHTLAYLDILDDYVKICENAITFTEELLEFASCYKNYFYIEFYCSYWGHVRYDYYELETLFMMAKDGNY